MKRSSILLSTYLIFTLFNASCKKQAPACTGNCGTINANGDVINKLTNASAGGVPVLLSWVKFVGGFSQSEVLTTVNSKSDGTFNFTANVDTTYLSKGYFLSLNVNSNKEYIILGYSGLIETRTYSFDHNAFQNVQFEVYRKATLKINLHRTQTDNFQSFSISHSNVDNNFYIYDYNVQSPQEVTDINKTEIDVLTVADVFTKIRVMKTSSSGTVNSTIDSIKCTTDGTNTYDVNF